MPILLTCGRIDPVELDLAGTSVGSIHGRQKFDH